MRTTWLRSARSPIVSACLASFLTAALVGGIAAASIPDQQGMIHGCYNNDTGALRVIDTPSFSCDPDLESELTWVQDQQRFRWLGPWEPFTSYVIGDAVAYGGSSFIAITDNPALDEPTGAQVACQYEGTDYTSCNVPPGDANYWDVLARVGDAGAVGTAGAPGAQGVEGPRGLRGPEGPRGPAGSSGSGGGSSAPTGIAGYQIVSKRSPTNDDSIHRVGVDCPNGKAAVGGGAHVSLGGNAYVMESFPQAALFNQKGWYAAAESQDSFPDDWFLEVYAICAKV